MTGVKNSFAGAVLLTVCLAWGCTSPAPAVAEPAVLRGASSYTPYDAVAMLWSRGGQGRSMAWVSSGAEAGQLLVSKADPSNRPDWILCTQGVVAGLAARGQDVRIIASVYVADDAILPLVRASADLTQHPRSLFIPKSSIELAFNRFIEREGLARDKIRIPAVERPGFSTIGSLLQKPATDADAIDFAILVDPFITNLMAQQPSAYVLGKGGLYEMHYSVVVRGSDLVARRKDFTELLRQLVEADEALRAIPTVEAFVDQVWGRTKDGAPERLPVLRTYRREPARLSLAPQRVRQLLDEEIAFFAGRYPGELARPGNVGLLVDESLLGEVAPQRVVR